MDFISSGRNSENPRERPDKQPVHNIERISQHTCSKCNAVLLLAFQPRSFASEAVFSKESHFCPILTIWGSERSLEVSQVLEIGLK